jgi:ABC-type branched-subunit amino acid transport system ATPase component
MGRAPYKISGAGIGYVPQGRRLFPSLSTEEHLDMLGSRNGGRWSKQALWKLFPRLAERRRISAAQLSGGEQQMLAVARALLSNPKLLIMDEPTAALGPAETAMVGELIRQLKQEGLGIFLVSHDMHDVFDLCDRVVVMNRGRNVGSYRVDEVTKDDILSLIIKGEPPEGLMPRSSGNLQ